MNAPQSPRLGAHDRVTLYLALVPYLLEHSPVSVDEAAAKFQVSASDMRDLVLKLSNLGIPGLEGLYLPNDLFEINFDLFEDEDVIHLVSAVGINSTPRFSGTEAATLVAGLQFISGILAPEDRGSVTALMQKIALGASATPANINVSTPEPPVNLGIIRHAFSTHTQVSFDYRNARGEAETRAVSPLRLLLVGDTWYLRGWCHLREALRTFRLDRVERLLASANPIAPEHEALELPESLFDSQETDLAIIVRVAESALSLISEYQPVVNGAASGGDVLVTIRFAHLNNVAHCVAQHPGILTIVDPPEAIAAMQQYAQDALARYSENEHFPQVVSQLRR